MTTTPPAQPAFDLTGKVALVTGGNGGIGLGMARGLASAGATVVIAGRNEQKNAAALRELEVLGPAHAVAADLVVESECAAVVERAAEAAGRLDVLVNNAGMSIRKVPHVLTVAEWREVLDVNLTSAFAVSQAAYPHLVAAGGGKIINIGSMMSIFGAPFAAAYAASKGGIVQLTKSLATAWAGDRIQVNAVLPGWIDTELTEAAREQVDGLHQKVLDRTPAGRWGSPADFAGVAVFLASNASDFVTGATLTVDGGFSALG